MKRVSNYEPWGLYAYKPYEMGLNGLFKHIYGSVSMGVEDYYNDILYCQEME